jgi:hypothetical protein
MTKDKKKIKTARKLTGILNGKIRSAQLKM